MKLRKLSEIVPSPPVALTDQIVGVVGGTTDALFSLNQINTLLKATSNLDFYVDVTGSNSNPGTSAQPFLTIQHAALIASKFDYVTNFAPTIHVAAGVFLEPTFGLILPELLNVGGGGGGTINGAGYLLTTIKGQMLDPSAQAAVQAYGSFAVWFINDVTIDANALIGVQAGTDAFIQLGNTIGFTDTGTFGPTLGMSCLQAAGGTVAVLADLHILQKLGQFGGSNNTSTTNAWGVGSLEILGSTITLSAGTSGDQAGNAWFKPGGTPTFISWTNNTIVNGANYVGAQFINDSSLTFIQTDKGALSDFPGDPTLNLVNSGTSLGFFNTDEQSIESATGIWRNLNGLPSLTDANAILGVTSSVPRDFFQVVKDETQTAIGGGIGLFVRDANTIKSITPDTARVTSQFDKTNDTTLADIPGLTINVGSGYSYEFNAVLFTTSNAATGVKASVGGTCGVTAIIYEGETTASAAIAAQTRATALGTAVGGVTAVTAARIDIEGLITVSTAGTITIQFAQNTAVIADTSSVLVGSYMSVQQIA